MAYKYEKQKWVSYDINKTKEEQPNAIVTADRLNHMEDGIELANNIKYNVTTGVTNINSAGVSCSYDESTKTNHIHIAMPNVPIDDITTTNLDTTIRSSDYLYKIQNSFNTSIDSINAFKGSYKSLKERLKAINQSVGDGTQEYYGCRWYAGDNKGKRTGKASSLTANVGIDNIPVYNDFDSIFPWCDIKKVYCIINDNRFEFLKYATNYNETFPLCVEIPKFYYKTEVIDDYFEIKIAKYRLDKDYQVPDKFKNKNGQYLDYVYIPLYRHNYLLGDNSTIINQIPYSMNNNNYEEIYEQLDGLYSSMIEDYQIIRILAMVEFSVLDLTSIMQGVNKTHYTDIVFKNTDNNIEIEDDIIYITFEEDIVDPYLFDDTDRYLAIVKNNNSTELKFDMEKVFLPIESVSYNNKILSIQYSKTIPEDWDSYYIIIETPYLNGSTSNMVAPSGSIINNNSGYYPCRYRYIENPWGNMMDFMSNIKEKDTIYITTDMKSWINTNQSLYTGFADDMNFNYSYRSLCLPLNGNSSEGRYHNFSYSNNGTDEQDKESYIACGSSIYDLLLELPNRGLNSYTSLNAFINQLTEEGLVLLSLCIGMRLSYKE